MKKIFSLAFCFINLFAIAQNLVPNGDFEQYSSCPNWVSQLDSALHWFTPTQGTSDYYNGCDTTIDTIYNVPLAGVPVNLLGYQGITDGQGYSGIMLYQMGGEYREYLEVALNDSLTANQGYHFQMFVNRCDDCEYTTDAIGAYFSVTSVTDTGSYAALSTYSPQVNNVTGNYFDSLNWTIVSGDFIAQGGEKYMTIGNFKNDVNTFLIDENWNSNYAMAYVYIDNVSLTLYTAINSPTANTNISIYPNPTASTLTIQTNNNLETYIILYDIASCKILEREFINNITLDTAPLAKGIYLYKISNKNGMMKQGKVVKE